MRPVVITSAVRTAIGNMGGSLKDVLPEEMAKVVIEAAIAKSEIKKDLIQEVILGQAKQSTDAPNIARVALLKAGISEKIPAYTVHRQCGSGMQAILSAVFQIQAGYSDIIVAGGVESMSTAPYYIRKARYGYSAGNGELLDPNTESQPKSQPEELYGRFNMGITAENVAEKYNITREEQDQFAYESQMKTVRAIDQGVFVDEIVPISIRQGRENVLFKVDEYPRRDTSMAKLARLRPVFKGDGTVTAGNSSGRNDGAAAVVVMAEETARALKIKPLVRFISAGITGVDPRIMGIGPVSSSQQALNRCELSISKIGLVELNEAFAAQSIAVINLLGLDKNIVNVNGGAISLGHPLGCTGTRITTTLIHEMIRRKEKYGMAALCVAGGLGVTIIYQNTTI